MEWYTKIHCKVLYLYCIVTLAIEASYPGQMRQSHVANMTLTSVHICYMTSKQRNMAIQVNQDEVWSAMFESRTKKRFSVNMLLRLPLLHPRLRKLPDPYEAIFLYCCPDCSHCPVNAIEKGG